MNKVTKEKGNDKQQLKGIIEQFPVEALISVLLESDLLPILLEAPDEHVETVKEGSAIKKVVFKGTNKWDKRKNTSSGWTRKRNGTRNGTTNKGRVVVTYLDGKTQVHILKTTEKVEYSNGQYFFPNAGTES